MYTDRATQAVIYTENLRQNIIQIRNHVKKYNPDTKVCIAVKADAYGHGAVTAAKIAEEEGIEYLAIATVGEGIELRQNGIKAELLLLSFATPQEFHLIFENKITALVAGEEYIKLFSKEAEKTDSVNPVFLAIDSGMGRIGCYAEDAAEEAKLINSCKNLKLAGMITHFSVADSSLEENVEYTKNQFKTFMQAVDSVKKCGIDPGIRTCANSAATLNNPEMHLDMVRPGIIVYGYYADDISKKYLEEKNIFINLKPVMALETKVVALRHFKAGKSISYGRTWTSPEDTDIAVLPVGYADGLLRRFSPGLQVTINGKKYPVRGRICMDQCMVDLGKNHDVKLFDKAVIFGPEESGTSITAEDLAKSVGTISYEVLTSISKRVERVNK